MKKSSAASPAARPVSQALRSHELAGRVALVTGAGSGIGAASAKHLALRGAKVALVSRTAKELRALASEIEAAGGEALVLPADVSREASMEGVAKRIRRAWGRLDFVVANAGINGLWAPLEKIRARDWDETLGINLRGTFLTVRVTLPLLKAQGGAVVIVSSVNGTRMFSNTGATAYATSKAAQVAFARMIALELAPSRVRVNTVCPGAIGTRIEENTRKRDVEKVKIPVEFPRGSVPLTPGGQPGSAEQVAELIVFLLSDAASHITGSEVFVDGAESLLQG